MYIVPTSYTEEELGTVEKNVAQIFEKSGATITKATRLGKLRFAYPIKHERYGHYVLLRFTAEPASIAAIDDGLRLNQKEILRHIVLRADEVSGEFNLTQFQEVHVETVDRRNKRPPRAEKTQDKEKEAQEQKEGVAALEEGVPEPEKKEEAVAEGIEELSAEDLQKKIDEALEEKA